MYHPINRINCPPLNKLNDLARLTLEFCLNQTLDLDKETVKQRFIQHFADNGYPQAGNWLWNKDVVIRDRVLQLLAMLPEQKSGILPSFLDDQDLETRFAEGLFHAFNVPNDSAQALNLVNNLLEDFYKEILAKAGAPGDTINEPESLDRQSVLRAYLAAQRPIHLNVCPGCDGSAPSVADGRINEDLDHIFPKSRYNFLAIHPLNLTPLCKYCNQTYKGSKDPILDADPSVEDVHSLREIFHPYLLPAKDHIDVVVEANAKAEPHFTLKTKIISPQENARLHSLQYLLRLEERWNGELQEERLRDKVEGFLLFSNQDEQNPDFEPDMTWLDSRLIHAIEYFRWGTGRIPGSVPAQAYTEWVAKTSTGKGKVVGSCSNCFDIV